MIEGYIKLHRTMLDHLTMPAPALKVWLFLLLRARFRPAKGLAPGDVMTTYQEIIDICSDNPERPMARTTVAAALDYLESEKMIRRHKKGRAGLSLRVTVVNWHRYQGEDETPEPRLERAGPDTSSPKLQVDLLQEPLLANRVNAEDPSETRNAGDEKNEKECLQHGEGRSPAAIKIHQLFIELTGKFPSGRDETLIEAGVKDIEDAGLENPGELLEVTMRKAARAYKPTRLNPRPHDFRWFIGWIRRAIADELARRDANNHADTPKDRAALRRSAPAGVDKAAGSKWVRPGAYDE